MPENVYTYLKFVRYRELENWSVQYSVNSNLIFGRKFELKKIGSFLTRNKTAITVEDNVSYKRVTIKTNNGGCYLRDELNGKLIGTKQQFVISQGQFILSKIDARNGAMGVVPSECDKAIITGNFWTFDVNEKLIDSHYLSLVTTTKAFVDFAEKASNGTTNRHYLQESLFLSQKIPLPSIEEQRALVSAYNNKISQSEAFEKQAAQVEQDIEDYLLSELGIKQKGYTQAEPAATIASEPQVEYVVSNRQLEDRADTYHWGDEIKKEYKFLKFVRFRDVERWDVYSENIKFNAKYNIILLGDLIKRIATGTTPPTSQKDYFNGSIKFFTPSDFSGEMYLDKSDRFISQQAIDDNKARLFTSGDILFVGIGSTVGKVGVVKDTVVSSNQQITGFTLETKKISPEYAFCFMNYNKGITTKEQAKTTLPIVNQSKIIKIPIPLPPIDIQNAIVEHINKQKEQIKQLRQQAESLRKEALEEFEKEIFE